jgi:hypothetical protein
MRLLFVKFLNTKITGGKQTIKTSIEAMIFESSNGEFSPSKKRITTFSSPPPANAVKILAKGRLQKQRKTK